MDGLEWKTLLKMDDLGGTTILGNPHIEIWSSQTSDNDMSQSGTTSNNFNMRMLAPQ